MSYTLTQQEVLNKLGITDFRHMTRDKVVEFASMLPHMDRTVAIKALEQFPNFCELATGVVSALYSMNSSFLEVNDASIKQVYDACNKTLDALAEQLKCRNDIESDERARIEDNMIRVVELMNQKDSENKHFHLALADKFRDAILAITLAAASIIGVTATITKSQKKESTQ